MAGGSDRAFNVGLLDGASDTQMLYVDMVIPETGCVDLVMPGTACTEMVMLK